MSAFISLRLGCSWQQSLPLVQHPQGEGASGAVVHQGHGVHSRYCEWSTPPRYRRHSLCVQLGDNLPPVDLGGAEVLSVSAGGYHSCAVLSSGDLVCWGGNATGQLGQGNINYYDGAIPTSPALTGVAAASASWFSTCALLTNGSVSCFGLGGTFGNSGDLATPVQLPSVNGTVLEVHAGTEHTCIRFLESQSPDPIARVTCIGNGDYGQLGRGSTSDIAATSANMSPIDFGTTDSAIAVSVGYRHTCVLLRSAETMATSLRCFGENDSGQLGLDGHDNIGDESWEKGLGLPETRLPSPLPVSTTVTLPAASTSPSPVSHTAPAHRSPRTTSLAIRCAPTSAAGGLSEEDSVRVLVDISRSKIVPVAGPAAFDDRTGERLPPGVEITNPVAVPASLDVVTGAAVALLRARSPTDVTEEISLECISSAPDVLVATAAGTLAPGPLSEVVLAFAVPAAARPLTVDRTVVVRCQPVSSAGGFTPADAAEISVVVKRTVFSIRAARSVFRYSDGSPLPEGGAIPRTDAVIATSGTVTPLFQLSPEEPPAEDVDIQCTVKVSR